LKITTIMTTKGASNHIVKLPALLKEIRACTTCAKHLPMGVRPVVQADSLARILIAGQAPGRKVHKSGVPFDDASGERLREWLGVDRDAFYDQTKFAILPMGFCYPGTGNSGDLPPRTECAPQWRARLLALLPNIELTLLSGQYAQDWHLPNNEADTLTETVKAWRSEWPTTLPLPHPSPRNNIWLKKNPWFVLEVVPALHKRVRGILDSSAT
jgi:uracil-DNA glycosylase